MLQRFRDARGKIVWWFLLVLAMSFLAFVVVVPQRIAQQMRAALLEEATRTTGQTCHLKTMAWKLPAEVAVREFRCGEVLGVDLLSGRLAWWSSLRLGRLAIEVKAYGLRADLTRIEGRERRQGVPEGKGSTSTLPLLVLVTRPVLLVDGHQWRVKLPYDREDVVLTISSFRFGAELQRRDATDSRWSLEASEIDWSRGTSSASFTSASFAGRWSSSHGVLLEAGEVIGPQASALLRAGGHNDVRVRARMEASVLAAFSEHIPSVGGELFVLGWLRGSVLNPEVDLLFRLSDGSWRGLTQAKLRAQFTRTGHTLRFQSVRFRHPAFWAFGQVEMQLDTPPLLSLTARSVVVSPDEVFELVGVKTRRGLVGKTFLTGTLSGPLEVLQLEWSVSGQSEVRLAWLPDAAAGGTEWQVHGTIRSDGGQFQGRATWLDTVRVEGGGEWSGDTNRGALHAEVKDLARVAPSLGKAGSALGLGGNLNASALWHTTARVAEVEVSIGGREITVLQSTLKNLNCTAKATGGSRWRVGPCSASDTKGGKLEVAADWDLQLASHRNGQILAQDLSSELLFGAVALLTGRSLPVSGGNLTGNLTYRESSTGRMASLTATLRQFRFYQEPISSLSGTWESRDAHWQLTTELSRRDGAERLQLRARGVGHSVSEATLSGDPVRLNGLIGLGQQGVDGALFIEGQWHGHLAALTGSLKVHTKDLKVRELSLGDADLEVAFLPQEWSIRGEALSGQLHIEGTVAVPQRYRFSVAAKLTELQLEPTRGRLRTRVSGRAAVVGRLQDFSVDDAEVLLTELAFEREPYRLAATTPVHLRFKDNLLQVQAFELQSDGSKIRIQGTLRPNGELSMEIRGASDLVLLEVLGPPVLEANGPLTADVQIVRGTTGEWQSQGVILLHQGLLEIEGIPAASALRGFARLEGQDVRDIVVEGEIGGGRFILTGSAGLAQDVNLQWTLRDVSGIWSDDLEATLSGSGTIRGPWQQLTIAGDIQVSSGLYSRDVALADLLRWVREQLLAPRRVQQTIRAPIGLDVRIHAPGNVFVDNNVAKVEFSLDLWVGGTVARPLMGGRISVIGGEVTAQGRAFTVTGGSVEFRDPASLNPWLNLLGETRVASPQGEYLITAQVTGQADRPRVHFSADDPSLSLDDVVSLLATGRTRATASTGFSPAGAALALLPKGEAEQQLQRWLGVDRFEVAATQARDTGAVEPRVTIGKELAERLYASASTSIGVQSRQTVQLEYRWSRRVSLLGSWESASAEAAGAFGGDVKFRVEFVRSPLSLLCP